VSKADQGDVKRDYWAVFDRIEEPAGHRALAEGRRRAKAFCAKWRKRYPSAVECVEQDLDALLNHLRFPIEHPKGIRHSNLIERTFGETRRRVKVIGRLPGERSCLSLVWAVLDRQSKGWRGLTMTPHALRHLQDLRRELLHDHPSNEAPDKRVTTVAYDATRTCAPSRLHQPGDATVHLAHPLGNAWGNRRVKNDLRDAEDLVDLLRLGRLAEAWIAPKEIRELRELVRHRAKLGAAPGAPTLVAPSAETTDVSSSQPSGGSTSDAASFARPTQAPAVAPPRGRPPAPRTSPCTTPVACADDGAAPRSQTVARSQRSCRGAVTGRGRQPKRSPAHPGTRLTGCP
jgi:hypothetical protein